MNRRSGNSGLLRGLGRDVRRDWQLYLFLAPAILIVLFSKYVPIYGLPICIPGFQADARHLGQCLGGHEVV